MCNRIKKIPLLFLKIFRSLVIIAVSVSIVYFAFTVLAGTLAPGAPPTQTMRSLNDIYTVMGGNYNSSAVSGSANGNILEILKCITNKMNGIECN